MSISTDIQSLNQIRVEIKRCLTNLKNFRNQAKNLEINIISYLKNKEQNGVKYQGRAIILENKPKSTNKNKAEQESESIDILKSYGISNPRKVLDELQKTKKGDMKEVQVLKFQNIK